VIGHDDSTFQRKSRSVRRILTGQGKKNTDRSASKGSSTGGHYLNKNILSKLPEKVNTRLGQADQQPSASLADSGRDSKKKDFKMLFKLATDKVGPSEEYGLGVQQQPTSLEGGD